MPPARLVAFAALGSWAFLATASASPAPPPPAPSPRWTASTSDPMVSQALTRAKKGGDEGLAAIALLRALSDDASFGKAHQALIEIASSQGELAASATWVAAQVDPALSAPKGLLRALSIVGPFPDTGAGLSRREGPEVDGFDPQASYEVGAYRIRVRDVPESAAAARGIPLDLLLHPRPESCSYLASRITLTDAAPFTVHVGSTGSVRLFWNQSDITSSEETHEKLVFDRLAARIEAPPGEHLLGLKVCSGALPDEGRVRIRFEDASGQGLDLHASSDLSPLSKPPEGTKLTKLETPLARALAQKSHAADSLLLAQALLRTLGGADDLQSPKAPGLLDELTRKKSASPDVVALAGFASPFSSSRSKWLNLSLGRALAARDLETASFAERQLVASRLSANLVDFAWAGLQSKPLADERDAEARLLRAKVQARMGLRSQKRLALDEIVTLTREKAHASVTTWEELASLASSLDPALATKAREQLAKMHPSHRNSAYVRAMITEDGAALRKAAEAALPHLSRAEELFDIADSLDAAGQHDLALSSWERAASLAPNRARAWAGLATALYRHGQRERADVALSRARELEPGNLAHRAELDLRNERDTSAMAMGDERYLVDEAVFLDRKDREPFQPGAVASRDLHWLRAVTLHPDRRVSQLMHYAREVVIEPRTVDELFEALPIEGDDVELLRARVHRASGGIAPPDEMSDGENAFVRWPKLKKGDVVEVALRSWTRKPVGRRGDPPFYFIDYAGSIARAPLLYNEVIVDSPVEKPLAVDIRNGRADLHTSEVQNGRRIERIVWEKPPRVRDEPLAPHPSETLPLIVGSTFASWEQFRAWYKDAISGFTEPDEQIKSLAKELTLGKRTRDEKVRALFDFVADEIRYVNYVSHEAWLPNRPQQLLARRQGDCDDKAILLIALLRAVGIEAKEALVQTRYAGQPSILLAEKAAVPYFDHGIAYLPGEDGAPGIWLDATSPQSRLGPLPSMDARSLAFFIDDGPAKVVSTPSSHPDEHGVEGSFRVTLSKEGDADIEADELHKGDHAFLLRTNLQENDARPASIERSLTGHFPTVRVGESVDFQGNLLNGAARVRYLATSKGLARREGDDLVLSFARATSLGSQLGPLAQRSLPVVLPPHLAPSHDKRSFRVRTPDGYEIDALPGGGEAKGGRFGHARITIRRDPKSLRTVIVEQSLVFDQSFIPVSDYPAFRAWLQEVDALFRRSLRFSKARVTHQEKAIAKEGSAR